MCKERSQAGTSIQDLINYSSKNTHVILKLATMKFIYIKQKNPQLTSPSDPSYCHRLATRVAAEEAS